MKRRILSILTALCLALTLLPATALAEEGQPPEADPAPASETDPQPQATNVATVNGEEYPTLAAAINAVPAGTETTVTLINDIDEMQTADIVTIPAGKKVILDMAGHSITVDSSFEGRPIENKGTLTVIGDGTIDSSMAADGRGSIYNAGTLTVKNGTFRGALENGYANIWNAGTAYFNGGTYDTSCTAVNGYVGSTTTITGGTYKSPWYPAVDNSGKMTITGGEFINTSCSSCNAGPGRHWGYTIRSGDSSANAHLDIKNATVTGTQGAVTVVGGTAEIHDGDFKTVPCFENHDSAYHALYVVGESYEAKATVYGGTFTAATREAIWVGNSGSDGGKKQSAALQIQGGSFTSGPDADAVKVDETLGDLEVEGGTFSDEIDEKYLADGSVMVQQGGQWVVGTLDELAVAEVNGTKYPSLEKAIQNATEGQTVKLLAKSISTDTHIEINKEITLDLNGGTITGTTDYGALLITSGEKNVTIKNGTITGAVSKAVTLQNGTATVENVTVTGVTRGIYVGKEDVGGGTYYGNLTVNGTSTVIETTKESMEGSPTAILVFGKSSLVVNDGTIRSYCLPISGNGAGPGDGTKIDINGGTISSEIGTGIFHPQQGNLYVTGGKIEGWTAIEMRSGTLEVSGDAQIVSTAETFDTWESGNGNTTDGAGIAIVQHTTQHPISVDISGGTIRGIVPVYEENIMGNPAEAVQKITLSISGGTFVKTPGEGADGKAAVYSKDVTGFIEGGSFSDAVEKKYLADTLTAQLQSASNTEAPYSYYPSVSEALQAAQPGDVVTDLSAQTGDDPAATYTVTLKYGDGRADMTIQAGAGQLTLPTPTRTNYTFSGWYLTDGTRVSSPYTVTGSVTLTAHWTYIQPVEPDTPSYSSGSSSEPTYSPTLDVSGGGTVKVSPRTPEEGETVTITPSPEAGYDIGTITVTDRNGKEVKVTEQRNSTYTFTQPKGRVTIEVTFVRTGEIVGETPFLDVDADAWYADAVAYVYANGLMSGTSANTFSPNATTTRSMIVTMLYRLEGEPDVNFGSSFNDVDASMYYADAVAWASQNGIVTGYDDTTFGPNNAITREQMAAILYRYAQYKGYDTTEGGMAIREYEDYAEISEYAKSAMGWAVSEGLVTGTSETTLTPEGSAIRAQIATIFQRFMENVAE